jgi:hypothetical protein
MNTEQKPDPCPSRAYVMDELTECQLDAGHGGVHLGRVPVDGPGGVPQEELVQWRDQDAALDDGPVSEAPVWYSVLPLGQYVEIATGSRRAPLLTGMLHGAVLDDHEQLTALVLQELADDGRRRVLIPWRTVETLGWEREGDE